MIVSLYFWFSGCEEKKDAFIAKDFTEIVQIKNWYLIGPFVTNHSTQDRNIAFKNKDLTAFGINEEKFNEIDLEKLLRSNKATLLNNINARIELLKHLRDDDNITNCYLYSKIHSITNQDAVLIIDGSRNYSVWFNQEKMLTVLNKSNQNKIGDRFVKVNLKKGFNEIFVKINKGSNKKSYGIVMGISPINEAKKIFKDNYLSGFIERPLIKDSLRIYTGPFSPKEVKLQMLTQIKS